MRDTDITIYHWKVKENDDGTSVVGFFLLTYMRNCVEGAVKYVPADPIIYCTSRYHANRIYRASGGPEIACSPRSQNTASDREQQWIDKLGYKWKVKNVTVEFQ